MSISPQQALIASDIDAYLKQHEQKELLRFLTCGSVDDGKSTLIGRLLYDSKMVYEDQMAALEVDSKRFGTTGGKFDPALLTDGLRAEREQGITIDVAYRYFSTAKRKFIIADTPGHEQYTRNMATGASTCDLAVILIDARRGVLTQTRRHAFIVSLLGIRHVVVAVNKMDLVDYSEQRFEAIRGDYLEFATKLETPDLEFVPMVALEGDNVVHKSERMPWYSGATMMHVLEHTPIASDRNLIDFRFPVQYVNRPHLDFRGFCGTVASGAVRPGDEVVALPSRRRSRVKSIVTFDGDPPEAFPPQSVTITLEDEIDVSRGDMLVHPGNQPKVDSRVDAMVVWMSDDPLVAGKQYLVKHACRLTPAVVPDIRYRIDMESLHRVDPSTSDDGAEEGGGKPVLRLNEIGRVGLQFAQSIAYDPYKQNRATGGFILVDRLTHNTVGAGMILDRKGETKAAAGGDTAVTPHRSRIAPAQRHARAGHKPATVWLTGLTGAGKTTLAYALEERLFEQGRQVVVLDGRNTRLGLNVDLDFTGEDRAENLRRAAEVARLFNHAGHIVLCAFLSPRQADRAAARQIISGGDRGVPFVEVHLDPPAEVANARAAEAASGSLASIKPFADLAEAYEKSEAPELTLPTHELSVDACADRVIDLLARRGVVD